MKVLVTGAGGFIGYNMCICLLEKGHDVVASYRTNIPEDVETLLRRYKNKLILSKGDLMDKDYCELLDKFGIDSVINGAVITSPNGSELETFITMAKVNIQTNINLLDFSIRNKVKNYIYISSSGVYGSKCETDIKISETEELDLFNVYCIGKRTSELLVSRYQTLTGNKGISARIAAPYGPYERTTTSRTAMSPIYRMLEYAYINKEIKIFGKNVVRDWTYVKDTVASIYELLINDNLAYSEYNVSNSVSYSLEDIAIAVKDACPKFEYKFVQKSEIADIAMFEGSQRGALNIERISKDTGFKPSYNIKKGIEEYCKWYSEK